MVGDVSVGQKTEKYKKVSGQKTSANQISERGKENVVQKRMKGMRKTGQR